MVRASTKPLFLAAVAVLTFGSAAIGAVYYVDDASSAPSRDGQSWPGAFRDLQLALTLAQQNDTIRVAQGTYRPSPVQPVGHLIERHRSPYRTESHCSAATPETGLQIQTCGCREHT